MEPIFIERTERREVVMFNGIRYRRYPQAATWAQAAYFSPRRPGMGRLHQEVWRFHNGPIPDGYEIHHVDDVGDNRIGNLRCVTRGEHKRLDIEKRGGLTERQWAHLRKIQILAAQRPRSDEEKELMRQRAKKLWEDPPTASYKCDQCDKEFEAVVLGGENRFCSNKCKSAWRRDAGLDDEQRSCEWCGKTFTVNRYYKTKSCTKSCAASARWARRRVQPDGGGNA
jgi:hypothetical protein